MDQRITDILRRLKQALEDSGIRVYRVILFGSHAAGTAGEDSDIDVAVLSADFEDMDLCTRQETVGRALARARMMDPVEVLAYTPKEYHASKRGTFLHDEISAKGVPAL